MSLGTFQTIVLQNPSIRKHPDVWIALVMLLSSLALLYPFRDQMDIVYRHWDGPLYMYIAKVWYNIPVQHPFQPYLPPIYFASHLPAYPFLIRLISLFTGGNYPLAMILATQISSAASAILFFRLLRAEKLVISPIWTAILFCFFPARWLISHTIGATEPLFLCFAFGALLAYYSNRTGLILTCIVFAILTRITGVLLIPVFGALYALDRRWREIALLPIGLLGILVLFIAYHFFFGDFFAYFRWNADRLGFIRFPPLEVYRFYASRINVHSTAMYYMLYVVYGIGVLALSKNRPLFVYCLVHYVFALFIFDFGLNRHLIPIAPFCLLLPLDHLLNRKTFQFLLFPFFLYLTYLYAAGWIPFPLMEHDKYQVLLRVIAGHN